MQINRINRPLFQTDPIGGTEGENVDPELQDSVEGFFNQEMPEEPVVPSNPFDVLFTGASRAVGENGGLPSDSRSIVTLEQFLIRYPEGRNHLQAYIDRMQSILQNRYLRQKEEIESNLRQQGLPAQQVLLMQSQLRRLESIILTMQQEIEKAQTMQSQQVQLWLQERIEQRDIDLDGVIRDENGEVLYQVATDPETGRTALLNPDGTVAVNPMIDANYMPALVDTHDLSLIDEAAEAELPQALVGPPPDINYDIRFRLNNVGDWLRNGFQDNTFGSQIDMTMTEGVWARKGENGEPVKNAEGRFEIKPFETVIREEDGKEMWGQKPPSEEEAGQWIFVRVTKVEITTEDMKGPLEGAGRYVHFKFFDNEGDEVLGVRVQGTMVGDPTHPLTSDYTQYVAASSVGVAANGGTYINDDGEEVYTAHSSRIRPIEVDAHGVQLTGRVLPAYEEDHESVVRFFEQLGVPVSPMINQFENGEAFLNALESSGDLDGMRAIIAARENLWHFVSTNGSPNTERILAEETAAEANLDVRRRFIDTEHLPENENSGHVIARAIYLPDDAAYNPYKTGISIRGLRGILKGADNGNNLIVVSEPNPEALREVLPYGSQEIDASQPAFGTYVEGGRFGKTIVVSNGGDLFAKDVTFVWREDSDPTTHDTILLRTKDGKLDKNNRIFVHIGDSNPEEVFIDNEDDIDPSTAAREMEEAGEDPEGIVQNSRAVRANTDDFYDVANPANLYFTRPALDTGDYHGGNPEDISAQITAKETEISAAINDLINADPYEGLADAVAGWQLPADIVRDDEDAAAFFDGLAFFIEEAEGTDDFEGEGERETT